MGVMSPKPVRGAAQKTTRDFIDLDRIEADELRNILQRATAFKSGRDRTKPFAGKILAMIFEKPSTRTRLSFEVAMKQLGGDVVTLTAADSQISRGETTADTARVLSRYVDAIMIRTDSARKLDELAAHASIPVINGLTDESHPCQVMADLLTLEALKGPAKGKIVAWSGDGNNVLTSWIHAAQRFEFELRVACPETLAPPEKVLAWAKEKGAKVSVTSDPAVAVVGADCVVTDTWMSMGMKNKDERLALLRPYRVDEALMAKAKRDAIFMHCLPAHRDEEVTAAVIDGPQSAVWDEAENRLHAQKGILAWCLG
jgi:ornithine carbamoyltransferase